MSQSHYGHKPSSWPDAAVAIIAILVLVLMMCTTSHAQEAYDGPHHFNVVFSKETTAEEVVWQALNVVDGMQTAYVADHPGQYMEVGQAGLLCGPHPTHGCAIKTMAGFAVIHYLVSVGIENLVQENPDYRVLQRVWQYTGLTYKAYVIGQNHAYGIKP